MKISTHSKICQAHEWMEAKNRIGLLTRGHPRSLKLIIAPSALLLFSFFLWPQGVSSVSSVDHGRPLLVESVDDC